MTTTLKFTCSRVNPTDDRTASLLTSALRKCAFSGLLAATFLAPATVVADAKNYLTIHNCSNTKTGGPNTMNVLLVCMYNQADEFMTTPYGGSAFVLNPGTKATGHCDRAYITGEVWKGEQTFSGCRLKAEWISVSLMIATKALKPVAGGGGNPVVAATGEVIKAEASNAVGGGDAGEFCAWLPDSSGKQKDAGTWLTTAGSSLTKRPEGFECGDWNSRNADDIVWHQVGGGRVNYWQMVNGERKGNTDFGDLVDPGAWTIGGVGDVDGDGTDDVVWHQVNGGRVNYWKMSSGSKANSADIGDPVNPGEWSIGGVGDVDGDGIDDIVWHQVQGGRVNYWKMNNGSRVSGADIGSPVDRSDWIIAGVGDVDGDGVDDIVWHEIGGGRVNYWKMNGGSKAGSSDIGDPVNPNHWKIGGVGDVDGDGTDDIIWHQVNGGRVNYWKMKEGKKVLGEDIGQPVAMSGWRIAGVGNVDK